MELVIAFARGDEAAFAQVSDRIDANVAPYPVGNVLSITGTMSGFPLASGLPQRAVAMLEAWECTEDWCARNTDRAPFSQPGLQVHFADAYARDWVETRLADLDGYLAPFESVGSDGSAVPLVYANSSTGCTICHGRTRLD
jgi:hypothetical protein